RARFDALMAHERAIAKSIERGLTQRLMFTSRELGTVRATALRLAHSALRLLSPPALTLLRGLLTRPLWEADVLAGICTRTGGQAALTELESVPGFVIRRGARVAVDETTAGLVEDALGAPDAAWLQLAADELRRAGDLVGAFDLALRAGDFSTASRQLG